MGKRITFKDFVMLVEKDQALTYLIENECMLDNDVLGKDVYESGSKVFDVLRKMEPAEKSDMELSVWHGLTDYHEVGFDVSGYGYNDLIGDKICQAIEGLPWNEWLAMPIKEDTLKELTPTQIVGYSMYEMTYFGWTEQQILEEISEFSRKKE